MVPRSISRVDSQNFRGNLYLSTRRDVALPRVVFTRDVAFTRDVEFTRDGNVTFSRDEVVLTKLGNWQDSTCL